MLENPTESERLPRPGRRSASAEAARRAEIARLRRMSALERVELALELGAACRQWAAPAGEHMEGCDSDGAPPPAPRP